MHHHSEVPLIEQTLVLSEAVNAFENMVALVELLEPLEQEFVPHFRVLLLNSRVRYYRIPILVKVRLL